MSRSYRKNYILRQVSKFDKKYANRTYRRKMNNFTDCDSKHGNYKHAYDSYKIHDMFACGGYHNLNTFMFHNREFYDSDKECIRDFNRWWKNK